jgi:aromatic-L-amino-acid decarboxylase
LHAKGLEPYFLTVSIGATSVCAVDDFESIAEVARDYPDIWIHCDAAYAGAALVLPEYQHLSRHMAFVDSFNFNMHKWLLTNFDASCLFVQNRRDLTDALSITPAYLRNEYTSSGLVTDYRDWQIPLGRRFRALKIWFVLRTWGVEGLREHIRHHIQLGRLFADLVRARPDLFSILAPPDFALTVVTINPHMWHNLKLSQSSSAAPPHGTAGDSRAPAERDTTTTTTTTARAAAEPNSADDPMLQAANDVTKEVFELIDGRKEWFLTSTVVGGVYAIRVVSANPLAEEKYVRQVFEELVKTTEEVLSKHLH